MIVDIVEAVEEASAESKREIKLDDVEEKARTIEFDVAVTVENNIEGTGKAGIKVVQFIQGEGEISKEVRNSTVSRVKFGVRVGSWTKEEEATERAKSEEIAPRDLDPYRDT